MKRVLQFFFTLLVVPTMFVSADPGVTVTDAWARATPPGMKNSAAYLQLQNDGNRDETLIGVTLIAGSGTGAANAHAELHESLHENGVSKMRPVENLKITEGESVSFEPGGKHIMLMGLSAPLHEGDMLKLELRFEKSGTIVIDVPVKKAMAHGHKM